MLCFFGIYVCAFHEFLYHLFELSTNQSAAAILSMFNWKSDIKTVLMYAQYSVASRSSQQSGAIIHTDDRSCAVTNGFQCDL